MGQVDRGADISWLSYFPAEAEVRRQGSMPLLCPLPPVCSLIRGHCDALLAVSTWHQGRRPGKRRPLLHALSGKRSVEQVLMPPLSSIEVAGDPRYVEVPRDGITHSVMCWPVSLPSDLGLRAKSDVFGWRLRVEGLGGAKAVWKVTAYGNWQMSLNVNVRGKTLSEHLVGPHS